MTEFDTKVVILRNPNAKKNNTKTQNQQVLKTKTKTNTNNNSIGGKKVNPEEEIPKQNLVGRETGLKIQKARTAKGFKQKDVANKMKMDCSVYQKYENGTAVRNGQVLNSLGKILGVKLTGKGV